MVVTFDHLLVVLGEKSGNERDRWGGCMLNDVEYVERENHSEGT
jgi:hypothetical protein